MSLLLYLVNLLCYMDILLIPQQARCLCKGVLELEFLSSIKRPVLTYGIEYACVLDMCLLPKKSLCVNKAYT